MLLRPCYDETRRPDQWACPMRAGPSPEPGFKVIQLRRRIILQLECPISWAQLCTASDEGELLPLDTQRTISVPTRAPVKPIAIIHPRPSGADGVEALDECVAEEATDPAADVARPASLQAESVSICAKTCKLQL